MSCIIALDEGTTSARAVVYDTYTNKVIAQSNQEFKLIYPEPGWVEADATEIWGAQIAALNEALAKSNTEFYDIDGIGITNQRETIIIWDKDSGLPLYNAIIWQCRRTSDYCEKLSEDKTLTEKIKDKTGLKIDAYFSATKIKWIFDKVPEIKEKVFNGQAYIGTVDSYIIYRLTKGKAFVTDATNASRTMLYNIHNNCWDEELCKLFDIPVYALPKVVGCTDTVGNTAIFKHDIPICGIAGDQQAALFGQTCFEAGDVKNTYGTGCFILMNTGDTVVKSKNNLISTVAWQIDGKTTYALEGSVFNAGSSVQWLRDKMQFFRNSSESEAIALSAKNSDGSSGTDGVYVVPAFTGLGAPWWNADARGIITGITRNTDISHIVRATLESMAYSTNDILKSMVRDSNYEVRVMNVDGGASANNFLMQFQSDIIRKKIVRPINNESTALGAVYLAGLGAGVWKDFEEIKAIRKIDREFNAVMSKEEANKLIEGWERALKQCCNN